MSEKLTSSLEDYLEAICVFIKKNSTVRAIDIARILNVSRASTTEALKKLSEKGLINYGRYDAISLTKNGEELAGLIIEKHNSLYEFFAKVLGSSHDEAQENACKIEHIISPDAMRRIVAFTNYYSKKYGDEFVKKIDL